MLKWCAYCQQFMGEVPDYDDFVITHGICARCEPLAFDFGDADIRATEALRDIQERLFEAGSADDLAAARRIIDGAITAGVRGVDILTGLIAPLLYRIGEDWKRGVVSVAEEHRFTRYCEQAIEFVAAKTSGAGTTIAQDEQADVLLMNAPGNRHTIAVPILARLLEDYGQRVKSVAMAPDLSALPALVTRVRPRILVISMALAEQVAGVTRIAEWVAELPVDVRPRVIVGGNAVKRGHVAAIPHAELVADISLFGPRLVERTIVGPTSRARMESPLPRA